MTIATAAAPLGQSGTDPAGARIDVAHSLREVAALWRELERDAVMSPYGRYDWIAAYADRLAGSEGAVRVAVMRGADGRPSLLMPILLRQRLGLAIATTVGGKHANFNLPVMDRAFAQSLTPERARQALISAGRALGADILVLPNMPAAWDGLANPFVADGQPSVSNVWSLKLDGSGETTLARSMSSDARKKMRNKARGIEKLGSVQLLEATCEGDVDRILEAFYRQKEHRFGELGIADPFADPALRGFMRAGALAGLSEGRPAIELYALLVGEEIVAVFGGAADAERLSGMIVSFADDEVAKFSPGEMLVTRVVALQCERGRRIFDLGIGDARYKRSICDEVEPLLDVILPLTLRGRAFGIAEAGLLDTKRRIKASPRAMALIGATRRRLASLRR